MGNKLKNYLTIGLFGAAIFGFSLVSIFRPKDAYSMEERRVLAQMPEIKGETLKSGRFMSDFENFTLDQFPLRNTFRTVKAVTVQYLMMQKDNNDYYVQDGYLCKLEYPMNEKRVGTSISEIQNIYKSYIQGSVCNVYLSVIPDKNYYLAPEGGYLTMDYQAFVNKMQNGLPFAAYIDISDTLQLDSFYRTDQHWRQEAVLGTAQRLLGAMDAEFTDDFETMTVDNAFYGAYYGQAALPLRPDAIHYLNSAELDACKVISYNTGRPKLSSMYDLEKGMGRDPYEMYLGGSDPLITIENPNAQTDKELVIFRDSFGSSITPLMVHGYKKITMVDLRYMHSEMLGNFVKFDGQDVLFLYSTLVLNNTIAM